MSGERVLVRLGTTLAILALLATGGGCRTAGDPYSDARIEAEIKARLVAQHDANLTRLGVVANDGTVYLSGAVSSTDQKARAESVARAVGGVRKSSTPSTSGPGRSSSSSRAARQAVTALRATSQTRSSPMGCPDRSVMDGATPQSGQSGSRRRRTSRKRMPRAS